MKKLILLFAFLACNPSIESTENNTKPSLNLYVSEQKPGETSAEVILITEFQCEDPTTQPFVRALGVAETLSQAATSEGKDLSDFLLESDQPQSLSDHISQDDNIVKLRFILSQDHNEESLKILLNTIQSMPTHVGKISGRIHEKTKSELIEAIDFFEMPKGAAISRELSYQLFEMLPNSLANAFMETHFKNSATHLIILYPSDNKAIKLLLEKQSDRLKETWDLNIHDSLPSVEGFINKSIHQEGESIVVDGKIFMDPPSFWQQEANGKNAGIAIIVLSVIFSFFTFGLALFGLIPGIFLLTQIYLADPYVVEKMRHKIFHHGFHYAYAKQCVGATLTPHERRTLFVEEIFDRYPIYAIKLSDFAAYYVLNSYDYNAMEMKEFLHEWEISQLKLFRSMYVENTRSLDDEIEYLENELSLLLAPYKAIRDADVEWAHICYNSIPAIIEHDSYMIWYQETKQHIKDRYLRGEIDYETRELELDSLERSLDHHMAVFDVYLKEAENALERELATIQAQYNLHILQCKMNINYEIRMEALREGKRSILHYYSDLASQYIMNEIDPYDSEFEDFLDLRVRS